MDIAYFGEPGLPAALRDIPLEYFARPLRWLAHQPPVLPADRYVGAGHLIDELIPYEPQSTSAINARGQGDAPLANANATANLWTHLLRFLAGPATQSGAFTIPASPGQ